MFSLVVVTSHILTRPRGAGRPLPGQAKPIFFTDPDVLGIAERLGASPAQVVISWGVQRGMVVIPKSENVERMKANITVRYSPLTFRRTMMCSCMTTAREPERGRYGASEWYTQTTRDAQIAPDVPQLHE